MSLTGNETEQELLEMRDKELAHIRKLRFVIDEIKSLDCSKFPAPASEHIQEAIQHMKISDYGLKGGEGEDFGILGLEDNPPVDLTYIEKKMLQDEVTAQLEKKLDIILDLHRKMQNEGATDAENGQRILIKIMEEERNDTMKKYLEIRVLKYKLLKKVAELKYGSRMSDKLEYLLNIAMQNETKSKILQGFFNNHLLNRYEHAEQALRELEDYLNKEE